MAKNDRVPTFFYVKVFRWTGLISVTHVRCQGHQELARWQEELLKFKYYEEATKFCKISTLDLTVSTEGVCEPDGACELDITWRIVQVSLKDCTF